MRVRAQANDSLRKESPAYRTESMPAKERLEEEAFTSVPSISSMEDSYITHRGTVYPWHCDHMGHMNVMWYVGKFDEATWQLFTMLGVTAERMRADGFGMVAVEQHLEYKREVLAGDGITIRSGVQDVREKVVVFAHEMTNDRTGELAARTVLTGVCIDAATRKSRPVPSFVRDRF